MKNKFLAIFVALCTFGVGIPVAMAAHSHGSGGGYGSGYYCTYYGGTAAGKQYCATHPKTPKPLPKGIKTIPTSIGAANRDLGIICSDAATVTGLKHAHLISLLKASRLGTSISTAKVGKLTANLLFDMKANKYGGSKPYKYIAAERKIYIASEVKLAAKMGAGIEFIKSHVHKDVVLTGFVKVTKFKHGKKIYKTVYSRVGFAYTLKHGVLTMKPKKHVADVKVNFKSGAFSATKKVLDGKGIKYSVGVKDSLGKTAALHINTAG